MCRILFACIAFASILAPESGRAADPEATFVDPGSRVSIGIELEAAHPYLAEYERVLTVSKAGGSSNRLRLAKDTGGYAAANLYRCAGAVFMLNTYYESVVVYGDTGGFSSGACVGKTVYVGIFDGTGSRPWRFYPASQGREKKLEMRGGY